MNGLDAAAFTVRFDDVAEDSPWIPVAAVAAERLHGANIPPNIAIRAQENSPMTKDGVAQVEKGTFKPTELPVFSVDLREAARRSESEVSEWAPERLDEAIQRYRKFFHLASLGPGVAPTRDIDLIWHLHMQAPVAYFEDCSRYCGHILDHDGGFGKTPEEAAVLSEVFARTAERWQQVFGEPYVADMGGGTKCWHDCQNRCWHACKSISAEVAAAASE